MTVALYVCLAVAIFVITRLMMVCRERVREQHLTDPLTALPNRAGFEAIVADHLKRDLPFSIVWLNLDGFRRLNELHGYERGDRLLSQIGPRIRRCLRSGDATARFGGDQFLILLRGHDVSTLTNRVLTSVSATAGISLYPNHGSNTQELLLLAETAMLQAKQSRRGSAVVYDPTRAAATSRCAEIAALIRSALTGDQFRLVYQPIVDAEGEIVRMEALVRVDDPILGRVAPIEFIGVAEQTGLIHEVGAWILRRACRQSREWRDAGLKTRVTINLSPRQVESGPLVDGILSELANWHLSGTAVTIHLTGAVEFIEDVERLRSAGILISSPDGRFDEIRVRAPYAIPVIEHPVHVIAQGIEKPEQLDKAHAAGCQLFQGFQIAPPLEASDATEILRAGLFADVGSLVRR